MNGGSVTKINEKVLKLYFNKLFSVVHIPSHIFKNFILGHYGKLICKPLIRDLSKI